MSVFSHGRRFIVTVADDFGKTASVNAAVAEAHDRGILTSASLMAGGGAFDDAVRTLQQRKALSVGIHVTLCDGRAVSSPSAIPGLAAADGFFEKNPARAWLRYSARRLRPQIEREVRAQFDRLEKAGIHPTHIDGHHHLQMHPVIFDILCREAEARGVCWIRMPREPLSAMFLMRSSQRGAMPLLEWAVFGLLGALHKKKAGRLGVYSPEHVFGLSKTGSVDEGYLLRVVEQVSGPVDEVFAHPDASNEEGRRELGAFTSSAVRERVASLGITLAGYRELTGTQSTFSSIWEKP
jgi:hopanoid biosynthesis associated protein HpnK